MMQTPDPHKILENSRVLFDRDVVAETVQKMADEINDFYGDKPIIMISVFFKFSRT